jgi:hypothetical protein
MSEMRELSDTELDAVCGGCHHHHHHPHHHANHGGGSTLLNPNFANGLFQNIFNSVLQNNITVQIGVALFGGSVTQISNSTNLSVV